MSNSQNDVANKATNNTMSSSMTMLLSVIAVLLAILIALIGYGVYKMSADADHDKDHKETAQVTPTSTPTQPYNPTTTSTTTPTATTKPTATAKPVAKNEVPAGWKAIKMPTYKYTAYRPSNYYYRFFDSGKILGIDPNPIPEASEYLGVVTLQVTTGDLETRKMEHIDSWMALAVDKKTKKNGTWDLVKGTIPGDEMMPEKEAIMAITKKGNYVYIVDYRQTKDSFDKYEKIFDQFYPAILFEE